MRTKEVKTVKKICLVGSSGGHLEELLMLKPLLDNHNGFIITEKTEYEPDLKNHQTYHLKQVNRKERKFLIYMIANSLKCLEIFLKERPDVIISTGALVTVPMCLIGKLFRKKLIYIESFANVNSPSLTGKLMYKFADQFYIQWESMEKFYPNAIYRGGIF